MSSEAVHAVQYLHPKSSSLSAFSFLGPCGMFVALDSKDSFAILYRFVTARENTFVFWDVVYSLSSSMGVMSSFSEL